MWFTSCMIVGLQKLDAASWRRVLAQVQSPPAGTSRENAQATRRAEQRRLPERLAARLCLSARGGGGRRGHAAECRGRATAAVRARGNLRAACDADPQHDLRPFRARYLRAQERAFFRPRHPPVPRARHRGAVLDHRRHDARIPDRALPDQGVEAAAAGDNHLGHGRRAGAHAARAAAGGVREGPRLRRYGRPRMGDHRRH